MDLELQDSSLEKTVKSMVKLEITLSLEITWWVQESVETFQTSTHPLQETKLANYTTIILWSLMLKMAMMAWIYSALIRDCWVIMNIW